jgi:DNA-binding NarL/FixJ family response regulator
LRAERHGRAEAISPEPEIAADAPGITEGTVRTHLHRLFEKTGTARQSDLVKLVAGYCLAP